MTRIDIDAYLERVGYHGPRAPEFELLEALQLHHSVAIPFENLDPLLGRPVSIEPASLEQKLVRGGRGGYCFEQNGLFFHVLTALGFKVTPLAARVRWMLPEDAPQTPLSHMMLKVTLGKADFICDVGFGGQNPTAPLPLESGIEQQTAHGIFRLRGHGTGYELRMRLPESWAAMYRFSEEPQSARDYEVFNWFTSTHPTSRFVNNLVAARVSGECRLTLLNNQFTRQGSDGRREHTVFATPSELHESLSRDFGICIARSEIEQIWPRLPRQVQAGA